MTAYRQPALDASWCQVRLPSGRLILLRSIDDAEPSGVVDEDEGVVEDVRFRTFEFRGIAATLQEVGDLIGTAIRPLAPHEATVELGLGLSAKTGQLIALFGEAAANASITVTLHWLFRGKAEHGDEA